jgi:thiol-disulfide isomerase/thioredoxin
MRLIVATLLLGCSVSFATIIPTVRNWIAEDNFTRAEGVLEAHRRANGVNPEMLEAHSWLGRGALARKRLDQAEKYASETRRMCLELLKSRSLDAEARLPTALGASIEVQGHVLAARGQRSEGVAFLQRELAAWRNTSMRTRIQKNINLLSLEGQAAPALEVREWVGPTKPVPLSALKGKAVLLFFWAHWCGDCKAQAPVLAQIRERYGPQGLVIIGPTQRFGYVGGGKDATPEEEKPYIEKIRKEFYSSLGDMAVPLSEENYKLYGSSTTPTLVLLDRNGVVRMYHPGKMPYEELAAKVQAALK